MWCLYLILSECWLIVSFTITNKLKCIFVTKMLLLSFKKMDLRIFYTKRFAQLFWCECVYKWPLLVVSGSWQVAISCWKMLPEVTFYPTSPYVGGTDLRSESGRIRSLFFSYENLSCLFTHWGQAMHICISKLTIIGLDNGLLPRCCQATIWNNFGK